MSLTQIITSSLQKNLVNGAGFYRSPNGIFEATWLPDERIGYIDIKNPSNLDFKALKNQALRYLKSLPKGKWEFNPDTPQKGRIYSQRIFKGVKGVTSNPNMPNTALILNTIQAPPVKQTIMKVKPKPNLKVGAGGDNMYNRQLDVPGDFNNRMFNHMNLEQMHKKMTPTGVFPQV